MNTIEITIILIFGLIVFIILFIISFINRLLFYKNKVIDKFKSIKDQIKERIKIIDTIKKKKKKNCPHEDNIIKDLSNLTTSFKNTDNINELIDLINKSKKILDSSTTLETTYNKLKNDKEYQEFKNTIKDNDDKIEYSASIYNETLDEYNNYKNNKYISILSKLLKFPDYNYYK